MRFRAHPGRSVFRPILDAHPEDESFPGLLIVRPEGSIFFNVAGIGEQLWSLVDAEAPGVVVFDFNAVPDIEYSALKLLIEAGRALEHDLVH